MMYWMENPNGEVVGVPEEALQRAIRLGYKLLSRRVPFGTPAPVSGAGLTPSPTPTTGGTSGAGLTPFPTPTPPTKPTTEQAYGPFTAYMQQMGLGPGYLNPAQQYQANLYEPLRNLWSLQQPVITAQLGKEGQPSWMDYLAKMVGGAGGAMSNIYGQAGNVLGGLFGMTPAGRQEAGLGFEPQYDPETGEPLTTAQTGARGLGELQALIQMALGQRYAGGASRWVASRVPAYQQTWQQLQAAGQPQISFLDYLRQRLGG